MNYDIIGDIHGHSNDLEKLLKKMGYSLSANGYYYHPDRQTIFEGLSTAIKEKLESNINITLKTMELNKLIEMGVIVNLYKNPKCGKRRHIFLRKI